MASACHVHATQIVLRILVSLLWVFALFEEVLCLLFFYMYCRWSSTEWATCWCWWTKEKAPMVKLSKACFVCARIWIHQHSICKFYRCLCTISIVMWLCNKRYFWWCNVQVSILISCSALQEIIEKVFINQYTNPMLYISTCTQCSEGEVLGLSQDWFKSLL